MKAAIAIVPDGRPCLVLLDRLAAEDLNASQFRLMLLVHTEQANQPVALAARMAMATSSVGCIFQDLSKRGLIRKERQKDDERYITYFLTEAGDKLLNRILQQTADDDQA